MWISDTPKPFMIRTAEIEYFVLVLVQRNIISKNAAFLYAVLKASRNDNPNNECSPRMSDLMNCMAVKKRDSIITYLKELEKAKLIRRETIKGRPRKSKSNTVYIFASDDIDMLKDLIYEHKIVHLNDRCLRCGSEGVKENPITWHGICRQCFYLEMAITVGKEKTQVEYPNIYRIGTKRKK